MTDIRTTELNVSSENNLLTKKPSKEVQLANLDMMSRRLEEMLNTDLFNVTVLGENNDLANLAGHAKIEIGKLNEQIKDVLLTYSKKS